jgi:hypothetical protein
MPTDAAATGGQKFVDSIAFILTIESIMSAEPNLSDLSIDRVVNYTFRVITAFYLEEIE